MADKNKNKNNPEKKGIGRKFKEMGSELKKVTWPRFPTALKNTGIVLLVVAVFLVILLIFDTILRFGVFNFLVWDSSGNAIGIINNVPILSNALEFIRPIFNL
ncbi:MAG: preprotein translocase subunit SecE [Firmicutes bacterium]|nr:preprotein translocase subunit SecE [Bacillota bacterium]